MGGNRFIVARLLTLVLLVWLTTACANDPVSLVQPTPIPAGVAPDELDLTRPTRVVEPPPAAATPTPTLTSFAAAPTFTPRPPTPAGDGLHPAGIAPFTPASSRFELAEAGDAAVAWRPPPVPAPHSLHPDDHYWLIRPIPSGRRNYDLEWYPYGSEPLLSFSSGFRVHHGVDFPNEIGTPILAAGSGTVIHAGPFPSPRDGIDYYGNTVIIEHDWNWRGQPVYTLYAHTLELFVEVGDYVRQGQLIAGVGASGEVTGPHLHLEVRVGRNTYNHTRNPLLWLAPYEGWGTLAGRLVDRQNQRIQGATVTVIPQTVNTTRRTTRSYMTNLVNSDEVWDENFVVADLPAGRYEVSVDVDGRIFRRLVEIRAGQTNFIAIQADFVFFPTATPTATPTAAPIPTEESDP